MESRVPFEPELPEEGENPPHAPGSLEKLKWAPRRMTQWFDPVQLGNTGVRALLSTIFGSYADKREVQAALSQGAISPVIHDYSAEPDIWIDYTADLGDGFDSTYTIAWLLGQPHLPAPRSADTPAARREAETLAETRRGRVLVLGGDQVYPTASREEYDNRFSGPYEAALPWAPNKERPRLFVVPGNHDWYDGLTSFIRLFCQERWIGGWQTRQARSYFALKLPRRWWLLGIDIQLQSDVDKPQIEYFKRVAEQMQPGDHVILCTAQPAWIEENPHAYDNLAFFERTVLSPRNAKLMLTLTGDLHHYSRYADSTGERHKITSGGGGAYLYGTHLLPERVELRKGDAGETGSGTSPDTKTYERKSIYPDSATSRRLRGGAIWVGAKNPRFTLFLGVIYALYAWMLQSASRVHSELISGNLIAWLSTTHFSNFGSVIGTAIRLTLRDPSLLALAALFVAALYGFCVPDPGRPKGFRFVGALHGVAHLTVILMLTWIFAWFNLGVLGIGTPEVQAVVFLLQMIALGGPIAAFLFGLALLPGVNFNEAYSAQGIENLKNFVRMHIDESGVLTIYPIGVDRVKRWTIDENAKPGEPYFRTRDGSPPSPRLIENPIVIPAPAAARVRAHAVVKEEA